MIDSYKILISFHACKSSMFLLSSDMFQKIPSEILTIKSRRGLTFTWPQTVCKAYEQKTLAVKKLTLLLFFFSC